MMIELAQGGRKRNICKRLDELLVNKHVQLGVKVEKKEEICQE